MTKTVMFKYLKENEVTAREVLPLGEGAIVDYFEGLDLSKAGEDKDKILKLVREFNASLEPYVKKYFRRFLSSNMSEISSNPLIKLTK